MIEERGKVISLEQGYAVVATQRRSACDSCSVNKGCGTGVISKLFGQRFNHVKALNEAAANVGDEVIVGLHEQALVRGSLAVYMAPLLFMFVMALLGQSLATGLAMDSGEGMSILFGLLGLGLGFLWLRNFSRKISSDEQYQPVILRCDDTASRSAIIQLQG